MTTEFVELSFDPGTICTGWCLWKRGRVLRTGHFHPKTGRQNWVNTLMRIRKFVSELVAEVKKEGALRAVAIEEFRKGQWRTTMTLMRLSWTQGALAVACLEHCSNLRFASKGQIKKEETAMLAKSYGLLTQEENELDAFQIGICAGFDKLR